MKKFIVVIFLPLISMLLTCAGDLTGEKGDAAQVTALTIRGGGMISWDITAFKVFFTQDLTITDHRSGISTTVSSSASPVTLGAVDHLGYLVLNSNADGNALTKIDVVASGAVPAGSVVLFQRTSEDTLWIPWVQKEIVSGDHWQLGTGNTWFERMASARKPNYEADVNIGSHVLVPASPATPAVVMIVGKLYANTSDIAIDLDPPVGRGHLDTGVFQVNSVYYLYAIPAAAGRTFDLVASATPPTGSGPTGFPSWSYIGAFLSGPGAGILPFVSTNGFYLSDRTFFSTSDINTTIPTEVTVAPCPVTIKQHYGLMDVFSSTTVGRLGIVAGNTSGNSLQQLNQTTTGTSNQVHGFVPALRGSKLYLRVNDSDATTRYFALGWVEDPMEFK